MKTVTGTKELLKALKKLEPKLQKRILNAGVKAGAKTVLEDAKSNAPEDTGELKSSLKVKKLTQRENRKQGLPPKTTTYTVGIDMKSMAMGYANVIEFGSKFVQGTHFMTKAFLDNDQKAIEGLRVYIKRRLDKLTKVVK